MQSRHYKCTDASVDVVRRDNSRHGKWQSSATVRG